MHSSTNQIETIKTISQKVRTLCEELKQKKNPYGIGDDLTGACAIASSFISHYLMQSQINNKVICVESKKESDTLHCYVETENFLVDVTYTQFNNKSPKVVILKKGSPSYIKMMKQWKNPQEVSNVQFFQDWHQHQQPLRWVKFFNKRMNLNLGL